MPHERSFLTSSASRSRVSPERHAWFASRVRSHASTSRSVSPAARGAKPCARAFAVEIAWTPSLPGGGQSGRSFHGATSCSRSHSGRAHANVAAPPVIAFAAWRSSSNVSQPRVPATL